MTKIGTMVSVRLDPVLAAHSGVREILTADRRDFAVYRLAGRLRFIDVLAAR